MVSEWMSLRYKQILYLSGGCSHYCFFQQELLLQPDRVIPTVGPPPPSPGRAVSLRRWGSPPPSPSIFDSLDYHREVLFSATVFLVQSWVWGVLGGFLGSRVFLVFMPVWLMLLLWNQCDHAVKFASVVLSSIVRMPPFGGWGSMVLRLSEKKAILISW